jgi:hypothetical protein
MIPRDLPTLLSWLVKLIAVGLAVTIGAKLLDGIDDGLPWAR